VSRIVELEEKVRGYDEDRHTERDRADFLERGKADLIRMAAQSDNQVKELERLLAKEVQRADEAETRLTQSRELVDFKNRILNDRDNDLAAVRDVANREKRRADEAEAKLMKGHVCTGGCSENRHVAFVGRQALEKLENQVAELTSRIDNTRVILSTPEVKQAQGMDCTRLGTTMSAAIIKALETLA
jgi:hypothetical protein